MVATVQIVEKNTATPVLTDKTAGTIRFKNADDANVDTANPMVIPAAGSDWSFEKWLRLNVTVAPDTEISNVEFYMDGANGFGTGVLLWAKAVAAYATPAEATSNTGYLDAFSYTSAAPLSLGAGPFTGTGEKADHVVMALEVGSTATQGALGAETATFSYDEI
jgi:hypothetical protein